MYKRGDWSCFMCSKWFGRKDVLRQHLVLHYKKQLGKQFVSKENNPEKNICGLCQFQAKDPKALIQHIALGTHLKKKNLSFLTFSNFSTFSAIFRSQLLFQIFCVFARFRNSAIFTFLFWVFHVLSNFSRFPQFFVCKYIYIFIFCVFFAILQFSRFPHFSRFSRFLRFPQFFQGFYRSVILGFFRFCCVQKLAFLFVIDNFCFRYTSKTQRFPTCTTQRLDIHY